VRAVVAVCALLALAPAAAAQGPEEPAGEGLVEQSCRALAGGSGGLPDQAAADPAGGLPVTWPEAPAGLLGARVDLRSSTETFNRLYAFALRGGRLYAQRHGEAWRQVPLPLCLDGRLTGISVDDDELVALDQGSRVYTMDHALKDATLWNWTSRWGTPFWNGPGYALPGGIVAWSWSVISPVEDGTWRDPAGNRTAIGAGKVSHIWGLRTGGQRLTFWDPWLPLDESYEMCGPLRGRFRAVNLSASGSHVFVIGANGEMYTRLYDFDISGHDPVFFSYSYEDQRGKGDGAPIQLPAEPWTQQPRIPGAVTAAISIHKVGSGAVHRVLRVEGESGGTTGYWERDIASPAADGWTFHATGAPLVAQRLDTSAALDLGPAEDARYVGDAGELVDFNVYCSPARLRIGGREALLHHVDGLRQQVRGRGLDDTPRAQFGAIEDPPGTFTPVTIRATRSEIVVEEKGWRFRRADASPASPASRRCLARRLRVGPRGVGPVRLGLRRSALPAPARRAGRVWRFCVAGGGRVVAVFSGGRAVLVATTAPRHAAGGLRPGTRRRVLVGRRAGRVRYLAVTSRPARLRRLLRLAGY
jgi:hypothetical protein